MTSDAPKTAEDKLVKFSDVIEIVSGVAPPDAWYYKGDTARIEAWQRAVERVKVELGRFLGVEIDE